MLFEINSILTELVYDHPQTSAYQIQRLVAPYAAGFINGSIIVPTPMMLRGNQGTRSWCELLAIMNPTSFDFWLSATAHQQDESLYSVLLNLNPMQCQKYVLPCVFYTETPYKVTCRCVHINELMSEYNMKKCSDLLMYIWAIASLGIFMNEYMAREVFEITNVEEFLAGRLFQGRIDCMLGDGTVSVFMDRVKTDVSVYTTHELMNSFEEPETDLSLLILKQKQLIQTCTFLGNETPQVLAMEEALDLSKAYSSYLKTPSSFVKVGSNVFDQVTQGHTKPPSISNYPTDELEVKSALTKTSGNITLNSRNTTPRFIPLFGGSSSTICDFGNGTGTISNTLNNFYTSDIRLI